MTLQRPLKLTLLLGLALPLMVAQEDCEDGKTLYELEMRDGVRLSTEINPVNEPAPTIVLRTPYGHWTNITLCQVYNEAGYNCVSQELRGTQGSEGFFRSPYDDAWGANQDGYDTIEWANAGDWSSDGVCISGYSALAIAGYAAAGALPPSLKCGFAYAGTGDIYHHAAYQGGAYRESLVNTWLNDIYTPETIQMVMDNPEEDAELWSNVYLPDRYGLVNIPIYHSGGWYDIFSQGTLDAFTGLHNHGGEGARGKQKLIMGPWTHDTTLIGELEYPDSERIDWQDISWFDRWLLDYDNGIDEEAPVRYYLMGNGDMLPSVANFWVETDNWPPESETTHYYFHQGGGLSTDLPTETAASTTYLFDPLNPVPSIGGNNLELDSGPYDQRSVLERDDTLVFTTEPLEAPVAVAGRLSANLFVSSSAPDTDFTVKIMDVYPDGRHMLVLDGILRMRYRDGQDHAVFMETDTVYEVDVDLWSTAMVFEEGHSISVAISSSNYPRFDVNSNTGGVLPGPEGYAPADNTVFFDAQRASSLVLPVIEMPEAAD